MLFNEPKLLKFADALGRCGFVPVSVLFNEPKLLKCAKHRAGRIGDAARFSALQRAEIAEMFSTLVDIVELLAVSVLFNEPKLLKL